MSKKKSTKTPQKKFDRGGGPGRLQQGVQEIVQMLRDQEALRVVVPIDVGLSGHGDVIVAMAMDMAMAFFGGRSTVIF